MSDFIIFQPALFLAFSPSDEDEAEIMEIIHILNRAQAARIVAESSRADNHLRGRRGYDVATMTLLTAYGFTLARSSLRRLEDLCQHDIRMMACAFPNRPSYSTFCRFINDCLAPCCDQLFAAVNRAIFDELGLTMDTAFLDGTKQEADANRYKFVWKPQTFHQRLDDKIRSLLQAMGLADGLPTDSFLQSRLVAERLSVAVSRAKSEIQASMCKSLEAYLLKCIEYEEKERICGPNRNSYYKTDHDATAMCLKDDYYAGLGSSMHAAYQVQFLVSHGLVTDILVDQNRIDMKSSIATLEKHRELYGSLPRELVADAGYGTHEFYRYLKEHGISAYVKYNSWQSELSGRWPALYELLCDGTLRCLGGRIGQQVSIEGRNPKKAGGIFMKVDGCTGCPFMSYCRRFMKEPFSDYKIFEIQPEFQMMKQEARDRLLSVRGIELRVNRSSQVEGCFGILKEDRDYNRFRRTGLCRVALEMMLECLGMNIAKYLGVKTGKASLKYWEAPAGTVKETFRKVSIKRLQRRVSKVRPKSVNERAKRNYRY